jgi:uncharacterized delta-60 repeat protein
MYKIAHYLLSIAVALFFSANALAASGDLDPTFGTATGYTLGAPANEQRGGDVLIDASGRYVMAAYSRSSTQDTPYLVRYSSAGLLDSSFGVAGKAVPNNASPVTLAAVKVLRAGNLLYLIASTNTQIVIYPFDGNGMQYTSFGGNGRVVLPLTDSYGLTGVVLQGSSILLATSARNPNTNNRDFLLARITTAQGVFDSSFGAGGLVWSRLYSGVAAINRFTDVALQSDGKIIAAGRVSPDAQNYDFVLARYLANGQLDSSYSGDGFADFSTGPRDLGREVAIQADGKALLIGTSCAADGSNCQPRVLRVLGNGSLDTSYGVNGVFAISLNYGALIGDLAIDSQGRAVASGSMQQFDGSTLGFVMRLTTTGAADTGFSSVGIKRLSYSGLAGSYYNNHSGVALGANSIVVSGDSFNSLNQNPTATVLARLLN